MRDANGAWRVWAVCSAVGRLLRDAAKLKATQTGQNIDWPTAEALAIGSLLLEKRHVRLSGQDVERGTFSQRHAVLHDQKGKRAPYVPLNHIAPGEQAECVARARAR